MFLHKLSSLLHPAALAVTLSAALPASPLLDLEPTLSGSQMRGFATGDWFPAALNTPGFMHGTLVDTQGQVRFEIDAVTHRIVPSEIPGYEVGSLYGRLQSARLQGEPTLPSKLEPSKPVVELASIYVLGNWSVNESTGLGRFNAVAYVEIQTLPMPIVLLDIGGEFRLPIQAPLTTVPAEEDSIALPAPEAPQPPFVVCYAGRDLYRATERMSDADRALLHEYRQSTRSAASQSSLGSQVARFRARWMTRD